LIKSGHTDEDKATMPGSFRFELKRDGGTKCQQKAE